MIDKSPQTIQTMFNMIAQRYDFINEIMSFGTQKIIKYLCIKSLHTKPNDNVIDLCCGTGDLARIIKKIQPKSTVVGVDFSEKMLEIAKDKNPDIKFLQCDVTNLPFADNSIDIVTMGFGLRNVQNTQKAMSEIHRILKPEGKFLHLDFGKKNLISRIYDKITPLLVSRFTDNFSAYSYLIQTRQTFPEPDDLIKIFKVNGFKLYKKMDFLSIISAQIMCKRVK
jgi:demethylmenaquinone methyltransferase/2-methoxy-6-polyprenyl-1,4-benzoquinol methylase